MDGQYQDLEPTPRGWLWSQQLQLYLGLEDGKLRFFSSKGELVLLPEEDLSQQAEQKRQRAEAAEQELARPRALLQDNPQDNLQDNPQDSLQDT